MSNFTELENRIEEALEQFEEALFSEAVEDADELVEVVNKSGLSGFMKANPAYIFENEECADVIDLLRYFYSGVQTALAEFCRDAERSKKGDNDD